MKGNYADSAQFRRKQFKNEGIPSVNSGIRQASNRQHSRQTSERNPQVMDSGTIKQHGGEQAGLISIYRSA